MTKVSFRPTARADLRSIYTYVADHSGPAVAWRYTERIRIACQSLDLMPNRGTPRDDLGLGIRTIAFEGRALIAYRVDDHGVRILRVIHAGQDYDPDDFIE